MASSSLSFDPRTVPIRRIDHDLPAVPSSALSTAALRARFAQHQDWHPEIEREPRFSNRPPTHAAVLIPLVMREPEPTVLLTLRTVHLSSHSGQIAFPGGKADPQDTDMRATALREAQEEVGLNPSHVQILGELPVYTTGSSFLVTPVVALVSADATWTPNPHEVADVFEVPLSFLMNPAHHQQHEVEWDGVRRQWFSMPYPEKQLHPNGQSSTVERYIWGATAAMLRNFYRFLMVHPAG